MQFFVPAAKDAEEAEQVWSATKKFAEENLGWPVTDRRIFSLTYEQGGKEFHCEVGQPDPRNGEVVLIILESTTYLVCTANRGVIRGEPILVGAEDARRIEDFE